MSTTYKAREGLMKRTIAGETLLVPVGALTQEFNGMIMLNESGSYLWDLLAQAQTKEQLITAMKNEFDADEQTITADVDEFLENGIKEKLILIV